MKNSCTWTNSFWKKGNCGSGSESHFSRSQNYKGGHIGPRFPNFQANFFSHYNRKLQNFQSWKDLCDDLTQCQYLMEKMEANRNPQMSCPGEYLKLAHSRTLANVCSHRLGALDILLVSPTWLFRAEAPKSQSVDWWRAIPESPQGCLKVKIPGFHSLKIQFQWVWGVVLRICIVSLLSRWFWGQDWGTIINRSQCFTFYSSLLRLAYDNFQLITRYLLEKLSQEKFWATKEPLRF